MGFFLTLFQIAMKEGLVSVIEGDLRAPATITGQPASEDQKRKTKSYGYVRPLAAALAALTVPSPMQPIFILSMVRLK